MSNHGFDDSNEIHEFIEGLDDEGLDDLELQLLEFGDQFSLNDLNRMGLLFQNPYYLDIWIKARSDTLH